MFFPDPESGLVWKFRSQCRQTKPGQFKPPSTKNVPKSEDWTLPGGFSAYRKLMKDMDLWGRRQRRYKVEDGFPCHFLLSWDMEVRTVTLRSARRDASTNTQYACWFSSVTAWPKVQVILGLWAFRVSATMFRCVSKSEARRRSQCRHFSFPYRRVFLDKK